MESDDEKGKRLGTMTPDFAGEVALVTGTASGMGRAFAFAFAHAGATVVMGDVDEDGGRESAPNR